MILLIDNYDSFVHNLARYFRRLGQETIVVRNDAITVRQIQEMQPQALVISPGPCTPLEAGISSEAVLRLSGTLPILGVCLGHQVIGQAFGGKVVRAAEPMHGRTSLVEHTGHDLFRGVPEPMTVCRYHSLVIEEASLPNCLEVTARTSDGTIMAVVHREHVTYGVQFHPEAILTQGGFRLLWNFLRNCCDTMPPIPEDEWSPIPSDNYMPPSRPVTF